MTTVEQHFARYRQSGDAAALGAVFDVLAPELLLVAAHLAGGDHAEDVVQATFLDAIKQQDRWDASRPLAPWLCGMLANHVREVGRQRRRTPDPLRLPLRDVEAPDAVAEANELVERVHASVDRLPRPYRQVLSLRLVHGLELQQIAHALDVPLGTVKTQLHRGTALLRRALPTGLATALMAALVSGRGLVAMREVVLGHAGAAAGAAAGSTGAAVAVASGAMFGAVVMQKVMLAVVVAVLAAGAWFAVQAMQGGPSVPRRTVGEAAAATTDGVAREQLAVKESVAPRQEGPAVVAPMAQRVETSTTGSIEVRVNWRSDGSQAADSTVVCIRGKGETLRQVTDTRVFGDLAPGGYRVFVSRTSASLQRLAVTAGETASCKVAIDGDQRLRLRVVDADERLQQGAEIWCRSDCRPEQEFALPVRSDADGMVAYHGWPLSTVRAQKHGLVPSRATVLPRDQPVPEVVRLELGSTGCIVQGVVVDPTGRPVAGATVAIAQDESVAGMMSANPACAIHVVADAHGRFVMDEIPAGDLPILAFADGFAATFARVQTSMAQAAVVTLSLQVGAGIRGRVSHRDGSGFAGVSVKASRTTVAPGFHNIASAVFERTTATDAAGDYRFDAVFPARVHLTFRAEGELNADRRIELHDGEVARCDVVLPVGDDICGTVVDADAKPMSGMRVSVRGNAGGQVPERFVGTDAAGHFLLRGLPDGAYRLAVYGEAARGAAALVPLAGADGVHPGDPPVVLRIADRPADRGWIEGRVVWPDGAEPTLVELSLYAAPGRDLGGSFVPQQRLAPGTNDYRIGPLPQGAYRLMCDVEGYDRLERSFALTAAQTLELPPFRLDELRPLRLRLVRPDGAAVQGAHVMVDVYGIGWGRDCIEESPGLYRSQALAMGRFQVAVRGADFAPERFEAEVSADPQHVVDHRVTPVATTILRFWPSTPPGGRWIGALQVDLQDATGKQLIKQMLQVDGKDHFDWSLGLLPGSYSIRASQFQIEPASGGPVTVQFVVREAVATGNVVEVRLAK